MNKIYFTFLITFMLIPFSYSSFAATYDIVNLGTPVNFSRASYAHGINELGQVVGNAVNTSGYVQAFMWDSTNGMSDLGALSGHVNSDADDINNVGQVVGQSYNYGGDTRGFLWDSVSGMQNLGTLGGSYSYANSINELGHVAGYSGNTSSYNTAYYWDDVNGMQSIGTLGGNWSYSAGINDLDEVVGRAHTSSGEGHAFLWDSVNGMTDIGTIRGYTDSWAVAINNSGQVVGQYYNISFGPTEYHAFLWDSVNGIQALGNLGGGSSYANGINNSGQVVGYSTISAYETAAFIWDNINGMQNLNDLIPSGLGWKLVGAMDINNYGQIVGYGDYNGQTRAFLLTPSVIPQLDVSIDIKPETLNLKSKGKYITVYIELEEGYHAEDIYMPSVAIIMINDDLIAPQLYTVGPYEIGDYDEDSVPDLMVKFDRQELNFLETTDKYIAIEGELVDGSQFEGTAIIRVK